MKTANFGGRSVQIVVGYRNLPELTDMLKKFSYRVLKDDCLALPKKPFMRRVVKLTKEQDYAYKQMSQLALAQFQGKLMTTATVMTQLMRLHQITCGHFTADDGTIKDLKNNRSDELSDLLNEVHGKVVIWAHYQYDVETIVERIKKEHGDNVKIVLQNVDFQMNMKLLKILVELLLKFIELQIMKKIKLIIMKLKNL